MCTLRPSSSNPAYTCNKNAHILSPKKYSKMFKVANGPSTTECLTRLWYVHTMEYYTATRMNHTKIYITIHTKLTNIIIGERRQMQRVCTLWFHSYKKFKINQCPEVWISFTLGHEYWGEKGFLGCWYHSDTWFKSVLSLHQPIHLHFGKYIRKYM